MFDKNTTQDSVKADIFSSLDPSIGRLEGGYTDTLTGAFALEIWKLWEGLKLVPGCVSITKDSPPEIILGKCNDQGIQRKPGQKAVTNLLLEGDNGVVVPKGKRFLTQSGLEYMATEAVHMQDGLAQVPVEASAPGTDYNQPPMHIVIQMETQAGIYVVTQPQAAAGGADQESLESLVERYHLQLQKPPTSANAYQYRIWALEVDGVGDALVKPLVEGPGTVGVTLAGYDMLPVDEVTVQRCKAHIEGFRPADAADILVASGQGVTIHVAADVTLSASTTMPVVIASYKQLLEAHCRKEVAFAGNVLPLAKASYLLMSVEGVEDYSGLTLNGGTQNIVLQDGQLPVIGEVTLT